MDVTPNHPETEPVAPSRSGAFRFSSVQFLIALAFLFVSAPFVEMLPQGDFVDGSLLTLVLILGVLAVGWNRWKLMVAILLAVPAVTGRWLHLFRPDLPPEYFLAPSLVFIVFLIANLLYFILHAPRVNAEVLCAGLSTYLLLGTAWMFAYLLVSDLSPDAFAITTGLDSSHVLSGFNAYYFSFITLSTVGYGDIVPASHVARMLAATEAVTGTLFMAVLIARLVALYSSQPRPARESGNQTGFQTQNPPDL
ncbi:MAG TPA: ion channel [Candidatus Acidoferrales bacterium]|nr:ion channel [Candidatus Acidoferrales bacterium]